MNEQYTEADYHKARFINLVMMLATSAMQHLGKIPNPMTQKAEVDLEGASATIDLIDTVALKTKGNLDADEEKMMTETLASLKMAFVETQSHGSPMSTDAPVEPPASETSEPTERMEVEASDSDDKKPKFQKKYD